MARLAGKMASISRAAQSISATTARLFAAEGAKVAPGDVLEEIARVTLFIRSDGARNLSGAEIALGGGWTAGLCEPGLPNCAPGLIA